MTNRAPIPCLGPWCKSLHGRA